ncbi:MAG: hypothetical protein IJ558_04760 [Treponema sp.]|nr:hypothetical protein [Treponema sp.]
MGTFASIVSVVSGCATILGFILIFVKYGQDKGASDAEKKEMRKDIDKNAKDIDALGAKVNAIQLENLKVNTSLSSDLGWIKASIDSINKKLDRKEGRDA